MVSESTRRGFAAFATKITRLRDLQGAHFLGYEIGDGVYLGFSSDEGFERISGFTSGRAASISVVKKDKSGLHTLKTFTYGKDGKAQYPTFEKAMDAARRHAITILTSL